MMRILETVGDVILTGFFIGFVGWLFWRAFRRSDEPVNLILKWIFTAPIVWVIFEVIVPDFEKGGSDAIFGLMLMLIFGVAMAITWRHNLIDIFANPIASLYDGGKDEVEPKPYYSVAHARRKRREFLQAVVAIREQLAKFPNDFEGVMLLAGIQAEDLRDLPSAELTLNHFCDQPNPPPKQFAAAMNQLADWHIKLAQDFDSARTALEKICTRFPDTELSLQAAQRIAHLGGTEKVTLAALDRQPVVVPEGVKSVGLLESSEHLRPAEADPTKLAAAYVKHLEQHPLDTEAREQLAVIYAEYYQRLDLATDELKQLIETPNQPAKKVAHWLNLLADLQIRLGADYETVRGTLEKIIERFPDLAAGEMARARLARLKLEFKGRTETSAKRLDVYQQNIGLKRGSPGQL
ncbi:MAG TPA: tetratricopeptide repeat protein [Candidatus Saccharimonadales bacterium]|nr:tetratricopeptide repeat protein [Candidatus Saccharimonadales bacterium]